jgi:hypothetical protein
MLVAVNPAIKSDGVEEEKEREEKRRMLIHTRLSKIRSRMLRLLKRLQQDVNVAVQFRPLKHLRETTKTAMA